MGLLRPLSGLPESGELELEPEFRGAGERA